MFSFQKWLINIQLFLQQSVLSININSPIGELFVLISQSFCDYLIDAKQMSNTLFTNFSIELKKQIGSYITWNKMQESLSQVIRRSSFIFKENHLFIEENNRSDKVVMITHCPSAPVRCAPVASPVNKFAEIASPVPSYASPVIND